MTKQLCRIQARAILWRSARQVTMPHYLCLREKLVQLHEESLQSFVLCSGERVGRFAILIKTALVTDADGAAVVRSGMRPHLQETTMLRHRSVTADIEVIANGTEATSLVVAHHLLHGITSITPRGRTMEHEEANGEWRLHPLAVFHASKEGTLAACYLLAYR